MPPKQTMARPVSVLIVDDEETIRELARLVLERAGATVLDEAENGVIALERYRSHSPPSRPRVVLLDNRMPGRSRTRRASSRIVSSSSTMSTETGRAIVCLGGIGAV